MFWGPSHSFVAFYPPWLFYSKASQQQASRSLCSFTLCHLTGLVYPEEGENEKSVRVNAMALLVLLTSRHSFFGSLSRLSSSCPGLENQFSLTAFLSLTFQPRHSSLFLLSSVHTFLLKHTSHCPGVLQSWLLSVNKLHTSWRHRPYLYHFYISPT